MRTPRPHKPSSVATLQIGPPGDDQRVAFVPGQDDELKPVYEGIPVVVHPAASPDTVALVNTDEVLASLNATQDAVSAEAGHLRYSGEPPQVGLVVDGWPVVPIGVLSTEEGAAREVADAFAQGFGGAVAQDGCMFQVESASATEHVGTTTPPTDTITISAAQLEADLAACYEKGRADGRMEQKALGVHDAYQKGVEGADPWGPVEHAALHTVLANPHATAAVYRAIMVGRVKVAHWSALAVVSITGVEAGHVFRTGERTKRGQVGSIPLYGARFGRTDMPDDGTLDEARAWLEERARVEGWAIVGGGK